MTSPLASRTKVSIGRRIARFAEKYAVAILLLLFGVGVGLAAPRFRNPVNIANILDQISVVGIVAMGMTILLITANFDLSIGGIVALSGLALAGVSTVSTVWLGVVCALIVGLLLGALNGLIVVWLRVNSLIATLGTGLAFAGIALLWRAFPIGMDDPILTDLVTTRLLGIRLPVYALGFCMLMTHWLLRGTVLGRYFYAVGSNIESARYAGVPLSRVQFIPFVLTGLLCSVASLILVGQLGTALPDAGAALPLRVIAAVVVGGVSISGGLGSVGMAFVGVLLLGVVANAFNMLNLNANFSNIFTGVILVLAVAVDAALRARRLPVTVR